MMFIKHNLVLLAGTAIIAAAALAGGCNSSDESHPAMSAKPAGMASAKTATVSAYTPEQGSTPITSCNIETFDTTGFGVQSINATSGQVHSISGWIAFTLGGTPKYWLRLDNKQSNQYFEAPVNLSIQRPDVVAMAGNAALPLNSGFKVDMPVNALPAGEYHVYLAAIDGQAVYSCDNGRQVIFK